jgi:hypothetical protein
VSEEYKKIRETYKPRGEFNIAIGSLPTLQMSHGLLALFEKIYYGELIFTDLSNIGEDVQYRCFNYKYDVKSVSQRSPTPKLLNEEIKELDDFEEFEYAFQLSKKRLAEAEYSIQFSETPPRRERVLVRWTLGQWTEH